MGFRQGGFMTVWSAEPSKSGTTTRVRLSSSRKNKKTNEYEQDFSGFCTFIGQAHEAAKNLKEKDRIKILECDVSTNYDKEKQVEYINYKVFSFEMADGSSPTGGGARKQTAIKKSAFDYDGEVDEDSDLPY